MPKKNSNTREVDEFEEITELDEDDLIVEKKGGSQDLLIPRDQYLASGVHIGTKLKTTHSEKWIYRTTSYGLYVINLLDTDKRIRVAARFLASFNPERVSIC